MKKISALVAILTLGAATVATAQTVVNQNAIAPKQVTTVKEALNSKDDTPVMLKGQVIKSLGDEKYQFKDATGTITVDVDDELWQNRAISPTTPVTLIGEVDIDHKPMKRVEIDVDEVKF